MELLVVVAVVALLAALGLGAARLAISKSHAAVSASNLRQMVQALNLYAADHDGRIAGQGDNTFYVIDSVLSPVNNNRLLHRDLAPYLSGTGTNSAATHDLWRNPADHYFYHNPAFASGTSTSYGHNLGGFAAGTTQYAIAAAPLISLQLSAAGSARKAVFAEAGWEITSRFYNGYDLGPGYNVSFLDGHAAYYPRTAVQGRYRTDW